MSAEGVAFSRTWPVGRYKVTMDLPKVKAGTVQCVSMEWDPHLPQSLTREERRQYQRGLMNALAAARRETSLPDLIAVDTLAI